MMQPAAVSPKSALTTACCIGCVHVPAHADAQMCTGTLCVCMALHSGLRKHTGKWYLLRGKNMLKLRWGEPLPEERQNSCILYGKKLVEEGVPRWFLRCSKKVINLCHVQGCKQQHMVQAVDEEEVTCMWPQLRLPS